ncbi:hypothetical protein EW146_g5724 [Bondarzewia mesenterica]|uniref:non-specific serine/threonine protein kinase n=1 Tax=Bondarzewia mesenterica TaxID=1095465 RepID=A0A4S4LQM1_9AGAM|nr:hypothetical protein EW146_g5724 [Bondarzewia mesenterica]
MPNTTPQRLPRRNRKGDDPKVIGLWKIGRTIGKGSSGRVRIARHSKTGQYAAVKIVSKIALVNSRMSMQNLEEHADRVLLGIEREIVIMKLISHPNIMRLYDVWETSTELYLILEYVEGGELFDYLCIKGRLSTTEALGYFQQIISAIHYCHSFNIAHRDLKPENLLLDRDKNIKVADFGMAAWQKNNSSGLLETACGSPHYAAPEVIEGLAYNGSMSDIWSCGVILFALLAGRLPFDDEDLTALLDKVKAATFSMPPDIDTRAKDLISRMLERDVSKRITIPEILKHPFYTSHTPKLGSEILPNLDEMARPLASKFEVDPGIFANLRTLWHGTPDDEILENLTNADRTWEKGVYHLLVQYRAKHMKEYDDQQEALLGQAMAKKSRKAASNQGSNPSSPKPTQLAMLPSPIPPRADPPTPRRAAGRNASMLDEEDADMQRSPLTPGLVTPQHFYSPIPGITLTSATPSPLSPDIQQNAAEPTTPVSPLSPDSPIWEALNMVPPDIPEIQDERVQQFFHQIMEHLNVMQMRSPKPASPNTESLSPTVNGGATARLGQPADLTHPSTAARNTLTQPLSIRRALRRPAPLSVDTDKENAQYELTDTPESATIFYRPSLKKKGARRTALADKRVQIIEPPENERGKLRRKRTVSAASSSPTTSDVSSLPSPLSPTWFGNLFKLRAVSFSLLSVHDADTTREECRRLLNNMGVRMVLTQAEGLGVLKCKTDEYMELVGIAKAAKFRVEVHGTTPSQLVAGYQTALHMVQEKGPLSTFKLVYNRLRREWDLDAPKIPLPTPSPALNESGRFAELMY